MFLNCWFYDDVNNLLNNSNILIRENPAIYSLYESNSC